ncbi:hypothetical protein Kisp01_26590 [Kineosporia sp. NBRC 101677]|uniref:hypothetical protein n=1 Tax=Kineosporia sp. NBRC 101677 TaxID=3032197 RepID=UPI0024A2DEA7|nr:hypothetical protein [Kineosporia sp. NBRC 101677]GLY15644.1 hypothetical protein Kisp01_26590 [Kineosporia sp. NBRC 101677]
MTARTSGRRLRTGVAGLLLATLLPSLTAPGPAAARPAELTILGFDSGRLAVLRNDATILAARPGAPLTQVAQARLRQGWRENYTDLHGRVLRWTEDAGPGITLHRLDLASGREKAWRTPEQLVAWTPRGWIGYQNDRLVQHLRGGVRRELLQLPAGGYESTPYVVSDGERTLVYRHGRLLLVTDDGRTTQALYDAGEGPKLLSGMTLTPSSVVWSLAAAPDGSSPSTVVRLTPATGETTEIESPGELAAATDESIAVVATHASASPTADDRHTVHRWNGSSWTQVHLPGRADESGSPERISGPVTDGTSFYLTVGPGIYRIQENATTRRVARS